MRIEQLVCHPFLELAELSLMQSKFCIAGVVVFLQE